MLLHAWFSIGCGMQDGELTPEDLLLMCKLGSLLTSRSINECISHEESLQRGHDLATQWLHPTAEPVELLDNRTSKPLHPADLSALHVQFSWIRTASDRHTQRQMIASVHTYSCCISKPA